MTNMEIVITAKIPTDDKKYECRTGPFEGFFVSSVEFCKHVKFDKDNDRKDKEYIIKQAHKAHQVHKGLQDHQVLTEPMVKLEQQVHKESTGIPGATGATGPAGINCT